MRSSDDFFIISRAAGRTSDYAAINCYVRYNMNHKSCNYRTSKDYCQDGIRQIRHSSIAYRVFVCLRKCDKYYNNCEKKAKTVCTFVVPQQVQTDKNIWQHASYKIIVLCRHTYMIVCMTIIIIIINNRNNNYYCIGVLMKSENDIIVS